MLIEDAKVEDTKVEDVKNENSVIKTESKIKLTKLGTIKLPENFKKRVASSSYLDTKKKSEREYWR